MCDDLQAVVDEHSAHAGGAEINPQVGGHPGVVSIRGSVGWPSAGAEAGFEWWAPGAPPV